MFFFRIIALSWENNNHFLSITGIHYQRRILSVLYRQGRLIILSAFFFLLVFNSYAQIFFNSGGEQVWVSEGAIVQVNGSVHNEGMISNRGKLSVTGDWQNEGIYFAGSGRLVLNGTSTQKVSHHGQAVSILQLEGTGEKVLESNLLVNDQLILHEGILTTSIESSLTLEIDAQVEGGDDSSFVNGPIINKGTGYCYFPVGINKKFHPLELLDIKGNNPVIQMEVEEPNEASAPGNKLERVSRIRRWKITTVEGAYSGSIVSLSVGSDEEFSEMAGIVVAEAGAPEGAYANLGQADFTGDLNGGTVTSAQIATLPFLALGFTSEFSVQNQVLVPSAFAPEAPDPENRILKIFANNIKAEGFVFKIFDRWRTLVYSTSSLDEAVNQGWDGLNQRTHTDAQLGVYNYYLRARLDNDTPVEQTGTITLFR